MAANSSCSLLCTNLLAYMRPSLNIFSPYPLKSWWNLAQATFFHSMESPKSFLFFLGISWAHFFMLPSTFCRVLLFSIWLNFMKTQNSLLSLVSTITTDTKHLVRFGIFPSDFETRGEGPTGSSGRYYIKSTAFPLGWKEEVLIPPEPRREKLWSDTS